MWYTSTTVSNPYVWMSGEKWFAMTRDINGTLKYYPVLYWVGVPERITDNTTRPHLIAMVPYGTVIIQSVQLPGFVGYTCKPHEKDACIGPEGFTLQHTEDS